MIHKEAHLPLYEQLDDLVVVCVSSEHDGSDVWGELGELAVHHQRGNLRTTETEMIFINMSTVICDSNMLGINNKCVKLWWKDRRQRERGVFQSILGHTLRSSGVETS